jgi:hypothetical protein
VAAPTPVAVYKTTFGSGTPRTVSVTTAVGDVLVAVGTTEDGTNCTLSTPTGGTGLTWTLQQSYAAASNAGMYVWTATATTAEMFTFSVASSAAGRFFVVDVLRFSDSDGVGASAKAQGAGAPSVSVTTTQANSALVVVNGDWNAANGSSRVWRTTAGSFTEDDYQFNSSRMTHYAGRHADVGATGSKTVGLSAPTGQQFSVGVVEVKGTAGGGSNLTATPADSLPLTDSANPVADRARSQSDPLGLTDTATATADRASTAADPLGFTDALSAGFDRTTSVGDPVGFTDATSATWDRAGTSADPLGMSDALTVSWDRSSTLGDPLGLTDAPSSSQTGSGNVSQSDALGLSDSVSVLWQRVSTVDDLLGLTDGASTSQANDATKAPADPLGFTDATSPVFGRDRTPGDALGMSDSVVAVLERVATLGDTLGLVDDATAVRAGANDGTPVRDPRAALTTPTSAATITGTVSQATLTTPTSRGTLT